MDKKSFTYLVITLITIFIIITILKFYRPKSDAVVNLSNFPLNIDNWNGTENTVPQYALDLLNPQAFFSATYVNQNGIKISLFFDFFSPDQGYGGPHSPRNCLPGAGWVITENRENIIEMPEKEISAHRLKLNFEQSDHIMDFWYITRYGETGNDYLFKIYEIMSAITFKPKEIAFVRFITENKPENEEALREFQLLIVKEIYKRLPFDK